MQGAHMREGDLTDCAKCGMLGATIEYGLLEASERGTRSAWIGAGEVGAPFSLPFCVSGAWGCIARRMSLLAGAEFKILGLARAPQIV